MEKINLVEILKNYPAGTKLYSPLFGEVTFIKIDKNDLFPIVMETSLGATATFSAEGRFFQFMTIQNVFFFHLKIREIGVNLGFQKLVQRFLNLLIKY